MADNHFEYATKADVYALESRLETQLGAMRQQIGELKGQMAIMIRLAYYMAGVLSAIAIKVLFFTKGVP
jgi:hypothetical protein